MKKTRIIAKVAMSAIALLASAVMVTSGTVASMPVSAAVTTAKTTAAASTNTVEATFKALSGYTLRPGGTFKTSLTVTKGKGPFTYRFGTRTKYGSTVFEKKPIKSSSKTINHNFTFTYSDQYDAVAEVTDATGASKTYTLGYINVYEPLDATLTTETPTKIGINSRFELNINIKGSLPACVFTTDFYYINNANNQKTYVDVGWRCQNRDRTVVYKFSKPGKYTPVVEVTDGLGNTITKKFSTVTVTDLNVSFGKVSSYTKMSPQQALQVAAIVNGGKAPYTCKFCYREYVGTMDKKVASTVKNVRSPQVMYAYKFTNPSVYIPELEVTDANGATTILTLPSITVVDFKVAFKAASSTKIKKSQTFKTTASVTNGKADYTYRYYYIQNGKKTYLGMQKISSDTTTYNYKFPAKGTYTPYIEVMDGQNLYASAKLSAVTVTD